MVVTATTGDTKTAASVHAKKTHRAEEVAEALALADPGCTTVLCDSKTAIRYYAKNSVCGEAARILRKVEANGCFSRGSAVLKWFPAHMGRTVAGQGGNANHEMANAVA